MLQTSFIRLGVVLAGACLAVFFLAAPAPEPAHRKPSAEEPSAGDPLPGLACPLCRAESKLVPIAYGLIRGGPKPTIADGVTCPPLPYHRGGCVVRGEVWYCNACREEFDFLPEGNRREAARLCADALTNGAVCERRAAASLLVKIDPVRTVADPAMKAALRDGDPVVRSLAARAISRGIIRGTRSADSTYYADVLIEQLDDEAESVRVAAINALRDLDTDFDLLMPKLVAALHDESRKVRAAAIVAISMIPILHGVPSSDDTQVVDAMPKMADLLADESGWVRAKAFEAILRLSERFDLSEGVARQMFTTLELALDEKKERARHPRMSGISTGLISSHVNGLSVTLSPAVDAIVTLADQFEVPVPVVRSIYATLEIGLANKGNFDRYSAIYAVEQVSTRLDVPRSTIVLLMKIAAEEVNETVRKRATECLAKIHAMKEAESTEGTGPQ